MLEGPAEAGAALSVYALLDAAREPSIVATLEGGPSVYQCLYEGEKAQELRAYAPYLAELSPGSPLLDSLAEEAVGKCYCVFATSSRPFAEVRSHFRRFLLVQMEDGKEAYFRFYDPRVLRAFLPACTREELAEFFGPIRALWVEGREEGSTMIRFSLGAGGSLAEEKRALSEWARGAAAS